MMLGRLGDNDSLDREIRQSLSRSKIKGVRTGSVQGGLAGKTDRSLVRGDDYGYADINLGYNNDK